MTKYLIIGKNGQLGSALLDDLTIRKENFLAYSRKELDVTNHKLLEKTVRKIKPKIIINTSAYHVIGECEENPLSAFEVNSVCVGNLAKLSKEIGAMFVTYSTNYVFDGEKRKSRYLENDRPNPLQMYGISKYAGELNALSEYSDGVYVIRTCGIYGKGKTGSRSKKGNYVLRIISEAKTGKNIKASKKQIVNPTFAVDLAKSSIDLINLKPEAGIYHLVNEGACSWYDFTKSILKYKNINLKVIPLTDKEEKVQNFKRPTYSALANIKAKKLGVVLPNINNGLERYLREI